MHSESFLLNKCWITLLDGRVMGQQTKIVIQLWIVLLWVSKHAVIPEKSE